MYNTMYILMCTFPSAQTPLCLITCAGMFTVCSFESIHICVCISMCHIWKCAMCQCRRSRARWNQSIATNHHLYPPPPPPPLPFLQRENPWRVELILLSCIISVTYLTFNISGGILNHDIFLFVPNISSKALPWKISAEYQFEFNLT